MEDEKKTNEEEVVEEEIKQDNTDKEENNDPIPYDRFKEVNDKKKELEKKLKELEEAEDSTETELEQMKSKMQEKDIKASLTLTALQKGIREDALEDFMKLAQDNEQVKVDEEGVHGVEELVEDFKENKKYLFNVDAPSKAGSEFKGNDYSKSNVDSIKKIMGIK